MAEAVESFRDDDASSDDADDGDDAEPDEEACSNSGLDLPR